MSIRINKLLSDAGMGSRREVEKFVVEGRVFLNGERAELSDVVVEDDIVTVNGEELPVNELIIEAESMRKYLSSLDDESNSRDAAPGNRARVDRNSRDLSSKGGPKKMRKFTDDYSDGRGSSKKRPSGGFKGSKQQNPKR